MLTLSADESNYTYNEQNQQSEQRIEVHGGSEKRQVG